MSSQDRDTPTPTIAAVIRAHASTGKSVGGLLDECSCGAAVDEYALHWQEAILRECFPHLAALHLRIVTEPDTLSTRSYDSLHRETIDLDDTLDLVREWTGSKHDYFASEDFNKGYDYAREDVRRLLAHADA